MIQRSWTACKWTALAVVVVAAVAVPYGYNRLDDAIRRAVVARLSEHYSDLAVSVRGARWIEGEGIEIRGLSIVEPGASGPAAELVYLEEVLLCSTSDWRDLLRGELSISHFSIRRPTVRLARRADGSWSASKLLPLPKLSKRPPRGTVAGGVIEVTDASNPRSAGFTFRDVNLKFGPAAGDLPTSDGRPPLRAQGHMAGDHLRRVELDATFDPSGAAFFGAGSVEGLDLSPELFAALPGDVARRLAEISSLRGQARISRFWLRRRDSQSALEFGVAGQLSRGRIDDPRLPYPLTELKAAFDCDAAGYSIRECFARSGQTTLKLDLKRAGYAPGSPLTLSVQAGRMLLNQELQDVLPASWRDQWHKFLPSGEVDLDLQLAYDGRNWQPRLEVTCRDVGFSYHKFPYALERATGKLVLEHDTLSIRLKAYSERDEIRLDGTIHNPGPSARVDVTVRSEGVPFDEKLLLALDKQPRQAVRSLHPQGSFNVFFRCWHGDEEEPVLHKYLHMGLDHCSIRYDGFPYPLEKIRGTIEMSDGQWRFVDLVGANDTGQVTCRGRLFPTPHGNEFVLDFEGLNVPLEEELREALSPGAARLWHELRPRGMVRLAALVRYDPRQRRSHVWVQAQPIAGEGIEPASIEPSQFPYRMENLRGKFTYENGRVRLEDLRAQHGQTGLWADGYCEITADGGWRLHLEKLAVDRLRADRELVQALTGRLRQAVTDLRPGGPIHFNGELELASSGRPGGAITSSWDLDFYLQQGSLHCGIDLTNLYGGARLTGAFDGQRFHSHGELDIDSVTYRDFQFTEVLGPIWIDDQRVLLGQWADKERGIEPQRQITARLYGGRMVADGAIELATLPRYELHATLTEADLARWAQESAAGRQQLTGQVWAAIDLRGKGHGLHNLGGRGNIQLRNADLYELPVILALLKTLSGRPPDTTAFTTAESSFVIEGEHIYLKQINCKGDAISLRGEGEMDLDRNIRATFYAVVGRDEIRLPLIDQLGGLVSQQALQIHVNGTLDEPVTIREVLPAVSRPLQQLQAESLARESARPRPATRGLAPRGRTSPAKTW